MQKKKTSKRHSSSLIRDHIRDEMYFNGTSANIFTKMCLQKYFNYVSILQSQNINTFVGIIDFKLFDTVDLTM